MPTLGVDLFSGGGGRSVKSNSRKAVEFGLTGALSTDIPGRPRFRLPKAFALLAAAALFSCAAFGLSQSAKAEGAFTVAGINSTLPAWSQTAKAEGSSQPRGQIADDSALSALTSFAQQIGAAAPSRAKSSDRQFDDQTFAALRDFAQRVGADQPASLKGETQLAEAKSDGVAVRQRQRTRAPGAKPPKGRPGARNMRRRSKPTSSADKACATCHAPLIAEFKKTLMGKHQPDPERQGQVRMRELPWSRLGAREGRRRPWRRRHPVVRG